MANKRVPLEVETAINNAKAAGWKVSIRNEKIVITPPGEALAITMGFQPNDASLQKFRRDCAPFNLIKGPASTPAEREAALREAEEQGQREIDAANERRKAQAAEEAKRQADILAARQKAEAAIAKGMQPAQSQEITMPKTPAAKKTAAKVAPADNDFPPFDQSLIGCRDKSKLQLANGEYYCPECWAEGIKNTFKRFQGGMSTHRGVKHGLYLTEEVAGPALPVDIESALEMLREAVTESLGAGADPKALADKDAEIQNLREQVAKLGKEADEDRQAFDRRFEEAQKAAETALKTALAKAETDGQEKRSGEVAELMKNFMGILTQIKQATETKSPIQAVAEIDTIIQGFLGR